MKMNRTLLLIAIVAIFTTYSLAVDLEKAGDEVNQGLGKSNSSDPGVNNVVDSTNKGEVSDSKSDVEGVNGKQEAGAVKDEHKESERLDSKSLKDVVVGEDKGSVRGKCDSYSNSCTDDDKTLVACLRVPGDESPDLSLLIQNKGKGLLTVTISAPDLVQLEKKDIELKEKEDTEVKVSIKGVENGHHIILTTGHGNCSLDFRDQFVSRKEVDDAAESTFMWFSKGTSTKIFLLMAALLIAIVLFSAWKQYSKKGHKYQMLDMELPVSHSSKLVSDTNEGWDDSWGDNWDDEEAPKTPSLPVTPSLSSKGMASRKFNKEHWKD